MGTLNSGDRRRSPVAAASLGVARLEAVVRATAMAALLLVVLSLLMAALMAVASPAAAADGALTPEQEKLASQIDGKLIAPCCWTQTVSLHESQKAEEIKMQVRLLLAQGKEEGEILDTFVGQYGEQILAAPRASGFNLLAYLLPFTALVVGFGGLALLVVRWRTRQPAMVPVAAESRRSVSRDDAADDLRRRLEDDLSHFDS